MSWRRWMRVIVRRRLRSSSDLALQATKHTARAVGHSMTGSVATECHLWLNLTEIHKKEKVFFLTPPTLKLGCLGRQSALWWISFDLPNRSRLPTGSSCLGGRGTPLILPPPTCPESAPYLERNPPPIRAHSPPTTVWGARGRPLPHRWPCRRVDLERPDRPSTSAPSSCSWPSGWDEESFHGYLSRQGQTIQTFLPASNTLSSVIPTQRFSVCRKRRGSWDASGFLPLLSVPPSPVARLIGDTFGFLPQLTGPILATLQPTNKDANDFPLWWMTSPPLDLFDTPTQGMSSRPQHYAPSITFLS